jgi:hypothetical protein
MLERKSHVLLALTRVLFLMNKSLKLLDFFQGDLLASGSFLILRVSVQLSSSTLITIHTCWFTLLCTKVNNALHSYRWRGKQSGGYIYL